MSHDFKMADDTKNVLALLNGLAKRTYYGESEITDDFLKQEIFPDLSDDDFAGLLSKCSSLIKSMVSADMDLNQSEAFLTSQMKKPEGGITENQANAFRKFWKIHKNKIHEAVISHSTWNNTLKQVSWRIDIQSQARHIDQINAPTAIMELQLGPKTSNSQKTEVVRFEMDETRLGSVLQTMQDIENEVNKYCQQ
ncbi:COMM domain-containing protein 1-like [Mercenaria mercenaria]|uniref:COMM domain-containing protein 1-like n=1 Tax=Mercenaria mercenaria TaxID=6596 RepID=UPI001E1DB3F3|nr:COMM domain-containing protein 1-like [Mercenaria mercenaria]